MKRFEPGQAHLSAARNAGLVGAVLLPLLVAAIPAAAKLPAASCSLSAAADTDTQLRNFNPIFTQVSGANPGADLKVTAIALRSPVGPGLFGRTRAKGRAVIEFDCFTNVAGSQVGRNRPRFNRFGAAAAARRVGANRNCNFLGANYSFTGTQVQKAEEPITAMTYVQRMASTAAPGCFDKNSLCLTNDNRFKAEVAWRQPDGRSGDAVGVATGEDTGLFYFFNEDAVEATVKILDACDVAGFNNFWVFFAAATDVEYTLTVTDTQTSQTKVYGNPLGQPAPPITDTAAFATCP